MAKGKRSTIKRTPRTNGPASDCIVYRDGEMVGTFTPKPKPLPRTSIVTLESGELIVRISDC